MSAITPQTNLKLLKVPIEIDNKNQLNFSTKQAQYNYFNSLEKLEVDDFTYQRKDNIIRYPANIDDIINYNYVMYQNEGFSDKWFYAYITNMEFINPNMTAISIKTDVFQTWGFDLIFKKSFVEREHVTDDSIGKHTIPEGLELGEYICDSSGSLYSDGNSSYIAIATTEVPEEISINTNQLKYNGIFGGGTPILIFRTNATGIGSASNFIRCMAYLGKANAIVSVYMIPQDLAGDVTFTHYSIPKPTGGYIEFDAGKLPNSTSSILLATSSNITPPSTIDGYTPKNNKLKVYPYSYLYVSNNAGSDIIYRYEDFDSNIAKFKTYGAITPGCSIKTVPINYKKLTDSSSSTKSFNYGINGGKYPVCSWVSDVYINWLTQNSINIGGRSISTDQLNIGTSGANTLLNLGRNVIEGSTATGTSLVNDSAGVLNAIIQKQQHEMIPNSANGNINSGDVTFSSSKMDIPYFKMNIRSEYAKIIDNYFSMYGYKVDSLKVPNINTRSNWNFIKTTFCNIEAYIPQEDLQEIKNMFNTGITIWHNPRTFLDYSQNNTIL